MNYTKDNIILVPKPTTATFKDIEGQQFGRLLVLGFAGRVNKTSYWWCQCICGNISKPQGGRLRHKDGIRSCGCLRAEQIYKSTYKHGSRRNPTYGVWCEMKARCRNPNHRLYSLYGGRGITVCNRWMDDFANFVADMGERPEGRYSIDRIDNNKNYCPDNCRWATQREQCNNQRTNIVLIFQDKQQTIAQWSRELGISYTTLRYRYHAGWSPERILTVPVLHK